MVKYINFCDFFLISWPRTPCPHSSKSWRRHYQYRWHSVLFCR